MAITGRAVLKAGAVVAASLVVKDAVSANADHIDPPDYPFSHKGWIGGFDASAIRRGHQVYTNVCATCHSMNLMAYRNLVDVAYTEDEVKPMFLNQDVVVSSPQAQLQQIDAFAGTRASSTACAR